MVMRKNYKSCDPVADYFLLQLETNSGDSITNLKMQKLCYYAQAWSLAILNCPIFDSRVEAWAHGPAIPELYQRFKAYRWGAIDPHDLFSDPLKEFSEEQIDVLDGVWLRYGSLSGSDLETLTHSELPWRQAYGDTPIGEKCTAEITHDSMKDFYRQRMHSTHDANSRAKPSAAAFQSESR